MATAVTRGTTRVLNNRRYEDYKSMKQHFQYSNINEVIFDGYQTLTNTAANLEPGDITVALIAAEACVFLRTLANDALQELASVWVTYQDNTGAIHGPILHLLNDTADTTTVAPLGNEDIFDTCASVAGDVITMTAMAATLNQYAGWYTVGRSGDGNQVGVANLIISNTAHGTTPAFTLTDTPNGNTATDVIQFQQYACDDFYRLREMYCDVEVLTDKTIQIGNAAMAAFYGLISQGGRYRSSAMFFTQPAATCRSFIGRIKCSVSHESTDAKKQGNEIQITYSPKAASTNAAASDITTNLVFQDNLDWQPCIELAGATDVTIQVLTLDNTNVDDMHVEVTYLEVYDVDKVMT